MTNWACYSRNVKADGSAFAYFHCNRSGKYVPKQENRTRNFRGVVSIRSGSACASHLTMQMRDGKYSVRFCTTHTSHAPDPDYLNGRAGKKSKLRGNKVSASIFRHHRQSRAEPDGWSVRAAFGAMLVNDLKADATYTITVGEEKQHECDRCCVSCSFCVHTFCCSCDDYRKKGDFCVHLHLLSLKPEHLPPFEKPINVQLQNYERAVRAPCQTNECEPMEAAEPSATDTSTAAPVEIIGKLYFAPPRSADRGIEVACLQIKKMLARFEAVTESFQEEKNREALDRIVAFLGCGEHLLVSPQGVFQPPNAAQPAAAAVQPLAIEARPMSLKSAQTLHSLQIDPPIPSPRRPIRTYTRVRLSDQQPPKDA